MQNQNELKKQQFFTAINEGNHILVDLLVSEDNQLLKATNEDGFSGINVACSSETVNINVIKTLLKHCKSPDLLDVGVKAEQVARAYNLEEIALLIETRRKEISGKKDSKETLKRSRETDKEDPKNEDIEQLKKAKEASLLDLEKEENYVRAKRDFLSLLSKKDLANNEGEILRKVLQKYPQLAVLTLDGNLKLKPVHQAVLNGNLPVIKILLEMGTSVNDADNSPKATPLHFAADNGLPEVIDYLLKAGANSALQDINGRTAAQVATANNRPNIADVINQYKPKPNESLLPVIKIQSEHNVPKLIHFIWAGGKLPMSDEGNIAIVKAWASANPDFQTILWVDQKTAPVGINWKEYYSDKFKDLATPPVIKDIEEKDNEKGIVSTPAIRYEIERLDPNYGASSDALRYRILYLYGGAYFDSDVAPGKTPLRECPLFGEKSQHVLAIDHLSQNTSPPEEALKTFKFTGKISPLNPRSSDYRIGNDAFICSIGNPLMKTICDKVEANYQLLTNNNVKMMYKLAYSSHNIKDLTLEKTGPLLVQDAILNEQIGLLKQVNENIYIKNINGVDVQIHPLKFYNNLLIESLKNMKKWLNVSLVRYQIAEEYISKAIATLEFELNNFGIIRLDDHVRQISQGIIRLNPDADPDAICQNFLAVLNKQKFDYNKVKVAQSSTQDEFIINFYREHQLIDKTCFLKSADKQTFIETFRDTTQFDQFNSLAFLFNRSNNMAELIKEIGYQDQQIVGFSQAISIGLGLIEKLLNENTYGIVNDEIETLLNNYKLVASKLEPFFEPKDKIDIELITELQDKFEQKQVEAILGIGKVGTSLLTNLQQSMEQTQQGVAEGPKSDDSKQHRL